MDQRGRKGEFGNVVHLPGQWPAPPEALTETQKDNWRAIVRTKPSDWFGSDTYPLLVEYVRAIDAADVLSRAMDGFKAEWMSEEEGLKRFERLSRLHDAKSATLARLATKMRLSQQSRYSEKVAATASRNAKTVKKPWEA